MLNHYYIIFYYICRARRSRPCAPPRTPTRARLRMGCLCCRRKGTNGVSTNGVTANFMFLTEGLFGYSVNLLVYSQKCQGVHVSPICQNY